MQKKYLYIYFTEHSSPSTAIHIGKHRVSSDPRSQANDGAVSTMMGDRMGILRAVVFCFCMLPIVILTSFIVMLLL